MKLQVSLRDVRPDDLPILFEQQLDPEANQMAAFTIPDPSNRAAFMEHWQKILNDETIINQAIIVNGELAGHIVQFEDAGQQEVGYWIEKSLWGKGIATLALRILLEKVAIRPIYARAAKDNIGSIRVLQKCGFVICGEGKGYSYARDCDVEEFVFELKE